MSGMGDTALVTFGAAFSERERVDGGLDIGGTASADFGIARSDLRAAGGKFGIGATTVADSCASGLDRRTEGGTSGIGGGAILVRFSARHDPIFARAELVGGWLFVAGVFPRPVRAGRAVVPVELSSMVSVFPLALRLTTSLLSGAA